MASMASVWIGVSLDASAGRAISERWRRTEYTNDWQ
jgi:hypothetical protein